MSYFKNIHTALKCEKHVQNNTKPIPYMIKNNILIT